MSEHLMPSQIERYRSGELSAAELASIDDHIGSCETCRGILNEHLGDLDESQAALLADWPDMLAGVGEETVHLSYEQVAAFVERELDDQALKAVDTHLNHCAECNERVRNLIAFRDETEATPLIIKSDALVRRPKNLGSFWQRLSQLRSLQLVPAAAMAALVLTTIVWLLWRSHEAPVTVALNEAAGPITLDVAGNLRTPTPLPPSYQQMLKSALTTQRVTLPPTLASLFGVAGRLRGASDEGIPFELIGPVGTVVESERPTLRWQPLSGATSYTVTLSDRQNEVATSPPLSATQWTVPHSLPRNIVYTWQVTALKDGERITSPQPPAPDARFKVLEQNKAQELELARKNYAGMHLLLGTLYAEAGLLDDAERELDALLEVNPQSPVARQLAENLKLARRPNSH